MSSAASGLWSDVLARYDDGDRFVVVADHEMIVRVAGKGAEAEVGVTSLVGRSVVDLVHPDDFGRAAAALSHVQHYEGVRPPATYRLLTARGYEGWDVTAVHEVVDGVDCIVFLLSALDERRRAEALAREQVQVMELLAQRRPIEECLEALTHLAERHVDGMEMDITCLLGSSVVRPRGDGLASMIGRQALAPHVIDSLSRGRPVFTLLGDGTSMVTTPIRSSTGLTLGYAEARRSSEQMPSNAEWSVHGLVGSLAALLIERIRADERLSHAATHDPLTDLGNRRLLSETLESLCIHGTSFGLAVVDLDQFSWINNTLGHPVGDQVLLEAADRLTGTVGQRATVCRPGGDEFVVVVPGITTIPQLESLGRRLHEGLSGPAPMLGERGMLKASIGLVLAGAEDSPEELLAAADAAMYVAKRAGGDAVHMPVVIDSQNRRRRFDMARDLAAAIETGELHLVYQPVIDLVDGSWGEVEALVRWEVDGAVVAGPEEFVEVAEQSHLILALDEWVLRAAGSALHDWKSEGLLPDGGVVWVNLSPRTIERSDLVDLLLEVSGGGPLKVGVEVTERAVDTDPERVARVLAEVRAAGIPVALDDFGTGVASLQQLAELPATNLKIDGSFVERMLLSDVYATLVETILGLAKRLGLSVTAEAIESAEQLEMLRRLGCDHGQGYLISAPRLFDDLKQWRPIPLESR